MAETARKTWLITRCSTVLGRALAECVLQAGGRVVAAAQDPAHPQGFGQGQRPNASCRWHST